MKPRKPIKRIGAKGRKWATVRASLKKEFESKQITVCEICGTGNGLSFAHRKKRRFITDESELRCVALICIRHHQEIEQLPHDEMFRRVTEIIENRESVFA